METSKWVLADEHPDSLTSMGNLALTYSEQGRWKEAEELEVPAMETSKRVLGEEHPTSLRSMAYLASTYRNQGRFKEAGKLEELVIETRKRVLGEEHPDTLTRMGNLAATYWKQGRLKEGEAGGVGDGDEAAGAWRGAFRLAHDHAKLGGDKLRTGPVERSRKTGGAGDQGQDAGVWRGASDTLTSIANLVHATSTRDH